MIIGIRYGQQRGHIEDIRNRIVQSSERLEEHVKELKPPCREIKSLFRIKTLQAKTYKS